MKCIHYLLGVLLLVSGCTSRNTYDIIIHNGTIIDGTGKKGYQADIGIIGDTIAAIGELSAQTASENIDASRLVVAPGFINMLSQAHESLMMDPHAQSDVRQGVTLEVLGEGWSMGPWNEGIKKGERAYQKDFKYKIKWNTLGEYMEYMEKKGVSVNIASFVGAATLRVHELGRETRAPYPDELKRMQDLAREAMEEGAVGLSTALIYTPGLWAQTDELIALSQAVAEYDGMYITHLRSEGDNILNSVDEFLQICDEAGIDGQIHHLKLAGEHNWNKYDSVTAKLDSARAAGLHVSTNMYTYTAAATGLDAAMPSWVQKGGIHEWTKRLKDPQVRRKVAEEMKQKSMEWENFYFAAGTPDNILLIGFRNDSLKYLTGKSLAEVAKMRGTSPEETAMDLVIQDYSRVKVVYFLMSEENIRKQIALHYMSFCSDAECISTGKPFETYHPHPRAFGNFARLLGKYVREEKIISLEEAIYKLSLLPATQLKIKKRGTIQTGYFADITIFDPRKIQDHATFDNPKQYATGVLHVLVNGVPVILNSEHTGAEPGRFVRGPGWYLKN
ncbi:MAG: D-aminoacylase [Bacteroidetes bacterium]|nr:D-aminoacylase [Bacteroidota bacterium]